MRLRRRSDQHEDAYHRAVSRRAPCGGLRGRAFRGAGSFVALPGVHSAGVHRVVPPSARLPLQTRMP